MVMLAKSVVRTASRSYWSATGLTASLRYEFVRGRHRVTTTRNAVECGYAEYPTVGKARREWRRLERGLLADGYELFTEF